MLALTVLAVLTAAAAVAHALAAVGDPQHRPCGWCDRRDRRTHRARTVAAAAADDRRHRSPARAARHDARTARRQTRTRRRRERKYPPLTRSPYPGVGLARRGAIPNPDTYARLLRNQGWPEPAIAEACARVRADRRAALRRWPFRPFPPTS